MAVVIFKAVEKCNSNCIYCDVIKKNQDDIMDINLLELIFKKMNEYLITNPEERITFTWHGGEVCLLGSDYFRQAIRIQDTYCQQTKSRIDHQVQSNLTLINQEMIDLFKQLGIRQIGSSFEPIPQMRGFGKKRDSETYNRKFMQGVNLLNKNHFTWGIIYVVHRKSLEMPLEIFYYLTNLNIRSHPNFNQVKIFGEDKHNLDISGEEFADFLGAIFPEWWKNRHRYPSVQPFARFTQYIQDHNLSLVCELSGSCSHQWLYIGPDGETSQCGRAGDYNIFRYGNIKDHSFQELMKDGQRDQFLERQRLLPKTECMDCRFWGICHGGCPLDAYMSYGDFTHRSPACDGVRIFIEKYFEPVTGYKADFKPEYININ